MMISYNSLGVPFAFSSGFAKFVFSMTNSTLKSDRETDTNYLNNSEGRVVSPVEKPISDLENDTSVRDSIALVAVIGFVILVGIVLIWIITK